MKINYASETMDASCPYCREAIQLVVDCSLPEQEYIEDCQVCCRPITIRVHIDAQGDLQLQTQDENSC